MVAAVGAMVDRMGREVTAAIGGMRTGLGERLEGLGSPGAAASKQAASRQGRKLCGMMRQGLAGMCGRSAGGCGRLVAEARRSGNRTDR